MSAVDKTIRDYKDGRLAFDQPEVGRLVQEIERLRDALSIFALDENWRLNHRCDPNSSHFDGLAVAKGALGVKA